MNNKLFICLFTTALLISIKGNVQGQTNPPEWAKNVIWYQIFVERFSNGNTKNDPNLSDITGSWPHEKPENWRPSNWTENWYKQTDWERSTGKDFYYTVQMRRFGGDFQGIINKIPYLKKLGVTAIYFNPLNDSPSLHKYDARNYRHMDRNFGNNPDLDSQIISSENPIDPDTWKWTNADSLFLQIVDQLHKENIKVIVDFSWNHTGITFWAWKDILKQQSKSKFSNWYNIQSFDDPKTEVNEFNYRGWAGVAELPEFKKIGLPDNKTHGAISGNLKHEVKSHIFAVTKRWLDPNNDGDPSDGIDGFRLDVAEMVPKDFWSEYREFVKRINPEAYLIGEVWWEEWPKKMFDPKPWLNDTTFDAIMNYRWFKETRAFFGNNKDSINAFDFVKRIDSVHLSLDYAPYLMNTMATHDSERLASSFANNNSYKFKVNPRDNRQYNSGIISEVDKRNLQLALIHQFTWIGAPHIWNGDEFLMTGADDPDNRKPIWWPDMEFQDEVYDIAKIFPQDMQRDTSSNFVKSVKADMNWFLFVKSLIAMRKNNKALSIGTIANLTALDEQVVSYKRSYSNEEIIVVFNNDSRKPHSYKIPEGFEITNFDIENFSSGIIYESSSRIINIPPKDVLLLKKNR